MSGSDSKLSSTVRHIVLVHNVVLVQSSGSRALHFLLPGMFLPAPTGTTAAAAAAALLKQQFVLYGALLEGLASHVAAEMTSTLENPELLLLLFLQTELLQTAAAAVVRAALLPGSILLYCQTQGSSSSSTFKTSRRNGGIWHVRCHTDTNRKGSDRRAG